MAYFFDSRISVQQGGAVNSTDTRVVSGQTVYDAILDKVYPIGSVYLSVNNVSPQTFLGGTWVAIGEGKALVGVNPDDTDYNASEMSGGSKTKTLITDNLPSHYHTISHTHSRGTMEITGSFEAQGRYSGKTVGTLWGAYRIATIGTVDAGTSQAATYVNSYDFYASRTWSGSTSGPSSGNSGSTGSGTAFDVRNPYLTVYMWKRTA